MENNVLKVNTTELSDIAKTLKSTSDDIYSTYKTKIINVLESSSECFYVSGLDSNSIIENFNEIYSSLNKEIDSLVDVLNNKIIPQYDELMNIISGKFNSEFSNQIQELLPGINKIEK